MGIFDRIAGAFERNNPDAVYTAELEKLDVRIAEVKDQAASLRAEAQLLESREDPRAPEVRSAGDQVMHLLTELKKARVELDDERVRAPADKVLADARIAMAEANSALGTTDEARGLNSIRDNVKALNERASPGMLDADGIPIHGRQAALGRKAAEESAREQLARMKAALKQDED